MDALRDLWTGAGLHAIETREITVRRTFVDFDDFWTINLLGSTVRPTVAPMSPSDVETLKSRVRVRLPADAAGHITCLARANAITGRLPK
jgi:hypothetical protein